MCRSAGNIDWILVDQEHGNISDDSMHAIVAAAAACGVSPVVRVMEGQRWMIKRALDAGAHGILVPMLDTAEEARKVVEYSKYPPLGRRGIRAPARGGQHPHGGPIKQLTGLEYLAQANSSLVIAVQIETMKGLRNVKEIAEVPGIDVLFIGPFDLGLNIGHPVPASGEMAQELVDAINKARRLLLLLESSVAYTVIRVSRLGATPNGDSR
ncbi:unnamed protein product [Clonostachys rhizophaga]|uniref:HpcH/HpaI aldolase/citrate lyase domain-containing protein n=1 Tax=Clonostachys rhizophaga TaxID=160324 RepID=A0A9N9YV44_9HYPO|nr:unnamed protein product [Clonostachys rhizophaga]